MVNTDQKSEMLVEGLTPGVNLGSPPPNQRVMTLGNGEPASAMFTSDYNERSEYT